MGDNTSFILKTPEPGFGDYGPEDELLHPEMNAEVPDDGATETQYFGFNIPEEHIYGMGYFWHHPNLGTVTSGVQAWRGNKRHHLACELYDFRAYQSDSMLDGNIDQHVTPCGYQVEIIDPFKKMRIQYADNTRDNAFDIVYTAVTPPAMLPNRKHFEQVMKTQGTLTLRGKTFTVDGYNVRDRTWAEVRPQEPVQFPPAVWLTGVFSDDFAFNCMVTDHPDHSPDWEGIYAIPADAALKGGWVYRDGKFTRIVRAIKTSERHEESLVPENHQLEIEDEDGAVYRLEGVITTTAPSGFWYNAQIDLGLVRWQCNGPGIENAEGWGDSQEVKWTDFVHAMQHRKG